MAGKTSWAALASKECLCHDEIAVGVASGELLWKTSNPGLAGGYCYTRADFEAHVSVASMTALASNELVTKGEAETYRILALVTVTGTDTEDFGASWSGRTTFNVNSGTQSVKVERSINGGAYSTVETNNVTPGSTGNTHTAVVVDSGQTLHIRLTPYTGTGGSGSAGTPVITQITEP